MNDHALSKRLMASAWCAFMRKANRHKSRLVTAYFIKFYIIEIFLINLYFCVYTLLCWRAFYTKVCDIALSK